MFDILVLGHSLSDPDIDQILKLAKNNANPSHPIYFVSSNFTKAEETELFEQYNIVLIRYDVINGNHSQLLQRLRTVDRFIVPRSRRSDLASLPMSSTDDLETAIALFLFRKLQGSLPADYLATIVLSALSVQSRDEVPISSIPTLPLLHNLTKKWTEDSDAILESLTYLKKEGLVTIKLSSVKITKAGHSKVQQQHTLRATERDQAFGQFALSLRSCHPDIGDSTLDEMLARGRSCYCCKLYRKRG